MKKALFISLFPLLFASCGQVQSVVKITAQTLPNILDSVVVVFSGDFMQHGVQFVAAKIDTTYDYDTQLKYISPFWKSADFAIINLETTLTPLGNYHGYPNFASPVQIAGALKRAGITHVALANNHSLDRSAAGVRQTAAALDAAGLPYAGVYQSDSASKVTMMLKKNRFNIAIINFTYGTNGMPIPKGIVVNTPLDTLQMGAAIDRAHRQGATQIIVYVHFGDEYRVVPNNEQKELALWLRARGANVVVGSHPHVAQPIDAERSIVYSLGNFVSNQRYPLTDGGYSVKIKFYTVGTRPVIEFMPHYVDLSERGVERYRVLMPKDSTIIADSTHRARMINSIEATRKIVRTKVDYE